MGATLDEAAKTAYNTFYRYDGTGHVPWESTPPRIQDKWRATTHEVMKLFPIASGVASEQPAQANEQPQDSLALPLGDQPTVLTSVQPQITISTEVQAEVEVQENAPSAQPGTVSYERLREQIKILTRDNSTLVSDLKRVESDVTEARQQQERWRQHYVKSENEKSEWIDALKRLVSFIKTCWPETQEVGQFFYLNTIPLLPVKVCEDILKFLKGRRAGELQGIHPLQQHLNEAASAAGKNWQGGDYHDGFGEPEPEPSTDDELSVIYADREEKYGHYSIAHAAVAKSWTGKLIQYFGTPVPDLSPELVALMMADVKVIRCCHDGNPDKKESYVDAHGYLEIAEELHNGARNDGNYQPLSPGRTMEARMGTGPIRGVGTGGSGRTLGTDTASEKTRTG